jgi:Tfp pilus assembly protein PilZ
MFRRLTVSFEDLAAFQREFEWHIAQGGIFIPTEERFQLREVVEVQLDLRFCQAAPVFEGEVVNQVRPKSGSAPLAGVAIQFLDPAPKLRAELEAITGVERDATPIPNRPGPTRRHPRSRARLAARVLSGTRQMHTHTLNVSRSGMLLPADADPLPVGEKIRVTLTHPRTGEALQLEGAVVRHEQQDGRVCGLGIQFTGDAAEQARFLEDSSAAAHARALGGISGDLSAIGVPNLLQMFPNSSTEGTLVVQHEDGRLARVLFENSELRHASVGPIEGPKALTRLVGWTAGSFEFTPAILPGEPDGPRISIELALLEALQHHDELEHLDVCQLPPTALIEWTRSDARPGDDPKLESEIVGQLETPRSVREVVDAVDSFDVCVYRAILSLIDCGSLRLRA